MKVIKKILLGLLLLVSTISLSQGFTMGNRVLMGGVVTPASFEITLTSISTSASLSPNQVINTGTTLDWTVSGAVSDSQTADYPTFDFSPVGVKNILIENTDDLSTLRLSNWGLTSADISESLGLIVFAAQQNSLSIFDPSSNLLLEELYLDINSFTSQSNLDISSNIAMIKVGFQQNSFTTYDFTSNINLEIIDIRLNPSLASVNITGLTSLITGAFNGGALTSLSVGTNTSLFGLECQNNNISSGDLDQIYIDLDNNGVINGGLLIDLGRTASSDTARANLITKGWTITEF